MAHDRERLEDFAHSYTDAWNGGETARVAEHYAPGGAISVNGGEPTPILSVAKSFMADFPEMVLESGEIVIRDDDVVEYHWTLRGDHAATGKHVHISGFEEWAIDDDGRVAASRGNFDAAEYERQVAEGA